MLFLRRTSNVSVATAIPEMTAMTISFWMKTQQESEGTALSYATQSQADELVITTHPSVRVILKGSQQGNGGSWNLNDGNWHFLWIEWQSSNGHLTIREGTRTIGPLTYTQSSLEGGGYLVLGQRQQPQKQFVAAKAFVGEISHVNIWSEKRTDFDVIRKDCIGLHTGTVFHLSDDTIDTRQSASIIAADTCPGVLSSLLMFYFIIVGVRKIERSFYNCRTFKTRWKVKLMDFLFSSCHFRKSSTFSNQRRG